ncbi:hypothetical protein [Mangrovicoccus algicola]|uniref:Uncharacterized protein n=1 Tax=Mangrovicoccus algicola TaxID=2771008 RepID=A0A8J6YSG3_9RHOB|nr:hypothetical protein [Mangrovicoccus algicola]MBE3636670.1 hypothetical protein [Mangrovicoccus algicola]
MQQDWMLDVLADLKSFAQQNGMFALAEHLDDSLMVAAGELAAHWGRDAGSGSRRRGCASDRQVAGGRSPG